ncbi:MAG TPA: PDDEXK nuclease domain-containing protein [Kofleriaceae bacterium]|nr:PDDEXK nuclease domain-containing protein [Kofleriaceae bacterium]
MLELGSGFAFVGREVPMEVGGDYFRIDLLFYHFRRYKILGACNPPLAYRALQAELGVGVMLPCNVVVYEDGERTVVVAIDPMETVAAGSAALRPIADEVHGKLARVLERLP